jgi:general stress protein 26
MLYFTRPPLKRNQGNVCFGFDEETVSAAGLATVLKHLGDCETLSTDNSKQWFEVGIWCLVVRY